MDPCEWTSLQTIILIICSISSVYCTSCIDDAQGGQTPWSRMDRQNERDRIIMLSMTEGLERAVEQFNAEQGSNFALAMDKSIEAPTILDAYRKVKMGFAYCVKFEVANAAEECSNSVNKSCNTERLCVAELWLQTLMMQGIPQMQVTDVECH